MLIAKHLLFYSASWNNSFPTPHKGQAKSSGRSSNFVPGAIPCSGAPFSSSYSQPHTVQTGSFTL